MDRGGLTRIGKLMPQQPRGFCENLRFSPVPDGEPDVGRRVYGRGSFPPGSTIGKR